MQQKQTFLKHRPLKHTLRTSLIILTLTFTLTILLPSVFAAPPQPQNVTVSGDETKPTVSWDEVTPEPNGAEWTEETNAAGWVGRDAHTSVTFDDKLWILGGNNTSNLRVNDVWSSEDGVNWTEVTAAADWQERRFHTSVVFDNKIWVMGGQSATATGGCVYTGVNRCRDVWFSEDGVNWTEATDNAGWTARSSHTSVVFKGKMWVIGGSTGGFPSDVWHSEDGVNWTEATGSAPWSGRSTHASTVFDGKIWVMGGLAGSTRFNDVWYSEDGTNWVEATDNAAWSERAYLASVVLDNKLWMMGGHDGTSFFNDVWYSEDGANWIEATGAAGWNGRLQHTIVPLREKIWVMGGNAVDIGRANDVWSTPSNTISHYLVCWDKTEGECSNSAKVDPDGEVIALNPTNQSWLAKLKNTLLPTASAQTSQLSYTLQDELGEGTWHFSVFAVTMAGEQSASAGTATHTVTTPPGLPDTGYGLNSNNYLSLLIALTTIVTLTGIYYVRRKSRTTI